MTFASLVALDNLESATLGTLSPDIRDSLHISSGAIVFISSASGAFLVFGAVPMGWLADRFRRTRVMAWASVLFAAMVMLSGLAFNALTLFLTRMGAGITKSNQFAVQAPLLADQYPIEARGRVFAGVQMAGASAETLSPVLVGGIAALAGGSAGWRWAFLLLAIPAGDRRARRRSDCRSRHGASTRSRTCSAPSPRTTSRAPISMEAAFSRLLQINTLRSSIVAFAAMGFGLFTAPVLASLFLRGAVRPRLVRPGCGGRPSAE